MITDRPALVRWQFDLTWALAELHLSQLTSEDFVWEPAGHCWTVHRDAGGTWLPDWEVPEPEPMPIPTIGWISWHIGWWWTVAIDHLQGRTPRERVEITWPGDGDSAIRWLRDLHGEWLDVLNRLTDADLDEDAPFPWPAGSGLTVAHTLAWVNAELMKNVAEIGNLRLLRGALAA